MIELLERYKERDQKGYVIESLWKFLIYSEIARTAIVRIKERPSGDIFQHEAALLHLYEKGGRSLEDDFTIRLERCVNNLIGVSYEEPGSGTAEGFRVAISEAIHKGVLGELRTALGSALKDTKRVAILVDNLDKAWIRELIWQTYPNFF